MHWRTQPLLNKPLPGCDVLSTAVDVSVCLSYPQAPAGHSDLVQKYLPTAPDWRFIPQWTHLNKLQTSHLRLFISNRFCYCPKLTRSISQLILLLPTLFCCLLVCFAAYITFTWRLRKWRKIFSPALLSFSARQSHSPAWASPRSTWRGSCSVSRIRVEAVAGASVPRCCLSTVPWWLLCPVPVTTNTTGKVGPTAQACERDISYFH